MLGAIQYKWFRSFVNMSSHLEYLPTHHADAFERELNPRWRCQHNRIIFLWNTFIWYFRKINTHLLFAKMIMTTSKRLNGVLALVYALAVFIAPRQTLAQKCLDHTKDNSWSLIDVKPEPIRSLDDIKDGVYSVELASTRTSCGKGQGMCLF